MRVSKCTENATGDKTIYLRKTDMTSAFRVLCMNKRSWRWLIYKAKDPRDGIYKYFVDKCLPFGASISCVHYQRFSNSLKHIIEYKLKKIKQIRSDRKLSQKEITNYLDDFLFIAMAKWLCNRMIDQFIQVCAELNIPVADEKTERASMLIVFLGILINGARLLLSIPLEKQQKALNLLNDLSGKKKITIKSLQVLTGYLNFLTKAIYPGRTFTRRIYSKYANLDSKLKQHHHVNIDSEFSFDCEVWRLFLNNFREKAVCRPMIDINKLTSAREINFTSDASAGEERGMGATFNQFWLFAKWETNFIRDYKPSIEYLELLGVTAALLTWGHMIQNDRVVVFCDNQAVVSMINSSVSSCKNCMYLLRLVMLNNLVYNRRVYAKYISTKANDLSDALSRLQFNRFWELVERKNLKMNMYPSRISPLVWPVTRIWQW